MRINGISLMNNPYSVCRKPISMKGDNASHDTH